MRFRGVAGLSCLVSVLILGASLAAPAAARVSTYKGQFQCDDRGVVTPLAGMNVELWERGSPDFLPVEIVGHRVDQDFTAADGSFELTTEDNNDNYFVRMALRDAHGVHLRDFWGINDWSVDTGAETQRRARPGLRRHGLLDPGPVAQVRDLGRRSTPPTNATAKKSGRTCRRWGSSCRPTR